MRPGAENSGQSLPPAGTYSVLKRLTLEKKVTISKSKKSPQSVAADRLTLTEGSHRVDWGISAPTKKN